MTTNNLQDIIKIFLTTPRSNFISKNYLCSVIMSIGMELNLPFKEPIFPSHSPSTQASCNFHNILLRVSPIHTQRMKLQQLTRIILIWLLTLPRLSVLAPIEIPKHGRTERRSFQQSRKIAHRMLSNHFAVIGHF